LAPLEKAAGMILAEIERRALAIAAELDRTAGPYRAEILDATPQWHIVRTAPGQENKATDFLSHRGIGVFLPKFVKGARLVLPHEVVDLSDKLLFPGRVFVFVWDVLAHWRRIMDCPGVQSIMVNGSEKPIVVPDVEMNRIQYLQFALAYRTRRRRKRYSSANDLITITSADYLHVDGIKRNRVLDAVLGAAS
jgi:transcription antitermination factor NusG